MIRIFIAVITAAFVCIAPARADFGDCMDSDYLLNFGGPDALTDPMHPIQEITCVVEFEIDYHAPRGERRIRGIRDVNGDWGFRPGALEQVEEGARAAVRAMKELGDFDIDDITILILDDSYERLSEPHDPVDGDVAAVTMPVDDSNECYITVYMFGPTGLPGEVAYSVAHEIFHCIQNATLTAAQITTASSEGAWWAEGSSDYFASLALPEEGDAYNRTAMFERDVDAELPLYDHVYGSTVFFYWFHHRRGAGALVPFLHQMAGSDSDAAQRAAMRAALSDEDWLDFAQQYADRSITAPAGQALDFTGGDGETITFSNSRTENFSLQPFVIRRGWLVYECGEWRNTLSPGGVNLGAREGRETAWGPLPTEIDTEEAPAVRYRFAALHTGDSETEVSLEVERTRSCEPCAGSEEIDVCVVGTWRMSGGGPIEWMRAQGIPITRADPGERIIRFDERGVYYTQSFSTEMTVELEDGTGHGAGAALPAAGRWSIAEGRLAICQDSGGMSGVVTTPQGSMPVSQAGGGVLIQDYSCSETSLQTTVDMGGSPMTTTYSKIAGPEDPDTP